MLSHFMTQRCFLIVYQLVDYKETSVDFSTRKVHESTAPKIMAS